MAANGTPEQPDNDQPMASRPSGGPVFNIPTKWLLIGGGGAGAALLAVIAVVALFLTGVISGGNPQPTSVLDLVPDDANWVLRMNLKRIFGNDWYADLFEGAADFSDIAGDLGINNNDLSEMVIAAWSGGSVIVMKGNFDRNYIRGELEDNDSEENTYRGYEVWENPDGNTTALLEEYLIMSDSSTAVENVLKNLYNGSGSLERADSDNEMKQILDKLGSGYTVIGYTGAACRVERCEGYGVVVTEVDEAAAEGTMEIALLFRNERAAERAAADYDEVADFLEVADDIDIEDTEAQGKFVVGVTTRDIEEDDDRSNTAPPGFINTAPTAAPLPLQLSRAEWIAHCYQSSPTLGGGECGCVYDYLQDDGYNPVPEWQLDWERDAGIVDQALAWCH